jgi:signal transduction histidine kinase
MGGVSATVYAVRVRTPGGPETVVAAMPLSGVAARVTEVIGATAGSGAGALVVVGAVAWLTAGRVLRPVERMRTRAAAITASADPSGRLPRSGTDELGKLAGTLNGMLASLERSAERQRRFVADAAHELRTPLAGLTAALEVARQHPGLAGDTLTGELLAGHRRLSRTLNDLLVLAALDGRARDTMLPVDLAGVVTDCSRRSVPEGMSLHAAALDRAVVLGSEPQLSRMVGNLVDSALRHARSKVELSVTASPGWARISVTDDGPGIPEADRERVWDRFVRLADDRSRASGGSGLGLAIVREIAVAHGAFTRPEQFLRLLGGYVLPAVPGTPGWHLPYHGPASGRAMPWQSPSGGENRAQPSTDQARHRRTPRRSCPLLAAVALVAAGHASAGTPSCHPADRSAGKSTCTSATARMKLRQ